MNTVRKRSRPRTPKVFLIAAALLVLVAAALSTKVVSTSAAEAADKGGFDPAAYAAERFDSEVAAKIRETAVDLTTLNAALTTGTDPGQFGKSAGSSSAYSFPVKFDAVAGTPSGSILPVTVGGVSGNVKVQIQIGPAINGTALRDAPGSIRFNDFTNQLEFQEIATELNDQAKEKVLAKIDPSTLSGKKISVIGAYTRVNPNLISVVPVSLEVQP
jgi:predicted lipoprotein